MQRQHEVTGRGLSSHTEAEAKGGENRQQAEATDIGTGQRHQTEATGRSNLKKETGQM